MKDIEQYITDTVIGRPYGFSVRGRRFYLYPVTLGKLYILNEYISQLSVNAELLEKNIMVESLRLAMEQRKLCISIISCLTCKDKDEVFDNQHINKRKQFFEDRLTKEDIASLMIIVLSMDKTNMFIQHYGIDKEQDRMDAVMRVKDKGSSLVFGGKSVFGTLIDAACERYGWTKEYVIWGIDYTSLRMMLADKITSVYLTDEEKNKLPMNLRNPEEEIIIPTKENMERIKSMNWQ